MHFIQPVFFYLLDFGIPLVIYGFDFNFSLGFESFFVGIFLSLISLTFPNKHSNFESIESLELIILYIWNPLRIVEVSGERLLLLILE